MLALVKHPVVEFSDGCCQISVKHPGSRQKKYAGVFENARRVFEGSVFGRLHVLEHFTATCASSGPSGESVPRYRNVGAVVKCVLR